MENWFSPETIEVIAGMLVAFMSSTGIWTYLNERKKRLEKELDDHLTYDDNLRNLVVALARLQLVEICIKIIKKGSITMDEADMITALYTPYAALGGNGNGEKLYHQCMNLPRVETRYGAEGDEETESL